MVGHRHSKYVPGIYISLSYFLHFTIGPISVAHLRTTPWPTQAEDPCGEILMDLNILCNEIPGVHLK